jgi:hypothetical protein
MKHLVKFSESIESSEWSDVDVNILKIVLLISLTKERL